MSWELESDARSLLWDRLVHPQLCYLKKVQVCAPQFPLSPVLLVPAAPPPVWGREGGRGDLSPTLSMARPPCPALWGGLKLPMGSAFTSQRTYYTGRRSGLV